MKDKKERRANSPINTPTQNIYINSTDKNMINQFNYQKRFLNFSFNNVDIRSPHVALMFTLLNAANTSGWKRYLDLEPLLIKATSGISNSSRLNGYYVDLENGGWIKIHQKGKNQYASTVIELCPLDSEVPMDNPLSRAMTNHGTIPGNSNVKADCLNCPYLKGKEKTVNHKPINHKPYTFIISFNKEEFIEFGGIDKKLVESNLKKIIIEYMDIISQKDMSEHDLIIDIFPKNEHYNNDQVLKSLEAEIMDFFNIKKENRTYREKIRNFLAQIGNKLPEFRENFSNYKKFKGKDKKFIHGLDKFLGSPTRGYTDGIWYTVDYGSKIKETKNFAKKTASWNNGNLDEGEKQAERRMRHGRI